MARARYIEIPFTVRGTGTFPYDMLRYDRCFPADEGQSGLLDFNVRERRSVKLIAISYDGNNLGAPTVGRWNSFLWAVEDVT